jgi:hypothetical protein
MKRIWRWFFPHTDVVFPTRYSPEEAVRHLAAAVKPHAWNTLFTAAVVGPVSRERVMLMRHRPWFSNSFTPVFTGRFEVLAGQTVLRGYYAVHRWVQFFVGVFAGIWGAVALLALWIVLGECRDLQGDCLFLLIPFGGVLFCLFLVGVGRWFARGDSEYVTRTIRVALAPPDR